MKFHKTKINDLYVVELVSVGDRRGFFMRSYCVDALKSVNISKSIKQVNHTLTSEVGSIRGMHYQKPPYAEIKMVRCLSGAIFDVAIDLREGSKTFLQWHGEYLTSDNHRMMLIPEGFAHGFQVVEPNSELLYFHTEIYNPESEAGVMFNDISVGIRWPEKVTELSDRDKQHPRINKSFNGI